MADEFCLKMPDFHVTFRDLLHAVNLRRGTNVFTSLPKEGVLRIFSPWKIRRFWPGLNPRTWVPKASTSRPPKPLSITVTVVPSVKYRSWWRHASENTRYERQNLPQYFEEHAVKIRTSTNISDLKVWIFIKKHTRYFCLCFLECAMYAYWYESKIHSVIPTKTVLCSLNIEP